MLVLKAYTQSQPVSLSGYTQGTTYSIKYYDNKNRNFKTDIEQILKDFDKSASTYDSSSVISRINKNDPDVVVDSYFRACYLKAMEVSKNTDGAFDITVGPLVRIWGFAMKKKGKVDSIMIDSLLKFVGYNLIELKGDKVIKKDPRVTLDFNAISGYSVDIIANFLLSKKINSFIIEIGGEVYAKGKKPDGDYWKVGIEKPDDNPNSANPLTAIVKLENMALSTSGNYRKFFVENGVRYSHEINPQTGYSAHNTLLSASVFASDCITADAYATAFMVMGAEKTISFLEIHPELQAYLIYSDELGKYIIYRSPGLEKVIDEVK
jgi:FAD:protein FMN transferase